MTATLDRGMLGEVARLTSENSIRRPRPTRDRFGRWHRDPAGEFDWLYSLPNAEREYVSKRYMTPTGIECDVLATMAGMDVDEWADAFVAAVRAARDRTMRTADVFSDEYEEAALSCYRDDVDVSELMGPVEVAQLFGVKTNTVAQWRKRFTDFPTPVATISGTFIWRRGDVEAWGAKHPDSRSARSVLK